MLVFRTILTALGYHCGEELLLSLRMDTNEDGYMYACILLYEYSPVKLVYRPVTPVSKYGCQSQMLTVCVAKEDQDNTANL